MGMLSRAVWSVSICGCAVLSTTGVRAAGVEDTVSGTVAIGRSANYVRANDVMAVWQNPANLALVPRKDIGTELRLAVFDGCFDRARNVGIAANQANGYLATESFEQVCNEAGAQFAGTLGFAMPLPRGFGFGVGLFSPGGVRKTKYGSDAINTLFPSANETVPITAGQRESPNRYLLLERDVLAAFIMAGAGYQPTRFVRFGLSVGGGVTAIKYKNVTSVAGGRFDDPEVVSDVRVSDAFVPRVTVSAAVTPIPALDLMASFTWNDDVEADGTLDVIANGLPKAPRRSCADPSPGPHCRVEGVTLKVPYQRFEVVIGARYAQRRVARERALDPIRDEVWDIELDAYWSQTGNVDTYELDVYNPAEQMRGVSFSSAPGMPTLPLPPKAAIFHGWRDTFGARLGGDYNVLRDLLALRVGAAYETRGVDPKNLSLDYWPLQKVTLSLGATVAFGDLKINAGYAHVFYESVDVQVGEGNVREIAARNPEDAQAVNEGWYHAGLDVFSLGANVSF